METCDILAAVDTHFFRFYFLQLYAAKRVGFGAGDKYGNDHEQGKSNQRHKNMSFEIRAVYQTFGA